VVSALGSFHGRTLATLAATGQPAKHEPFAPMPEGFRTSLGRPRRDARRGRRSVAAVLIEPIQGEGGVIPAPEGYLQGIRDLCDEVGALMMVDEIQTGFARTGTWFGFEHSGVQPDVVTLAKAMGNGMPIGACWARREVAAVFQPGRPRQHLQRHGDRHRGGARGDRRRDAPARRTGARAPAGCRRSRRAPGGDPAGRVGAWRRAAARPSSPRHRCRPPTGRCSVAA
jgi:adenosylmethionine-8-amino-7-oxononanoate aminotransferase